MRACDGCWGMKEAMICLDAIKHFREIPFWRREREWNRFESKEFLENIVKQTNALINQYRR